MPRHRLIFHGLLVASLLTHTLAAQKVTPVPAGSLPRLTPQSDLSPDMTALFERVRSATYHPADVALKCDAIIDWSGIMAKLGPAVTTPERIKALNDLRVHVSTSPSTPADIQFSWTSDFPEASRAQMEQGARQMLAGFFQSFWIFTGTKYYPLSKDRPTMRRDDDENYLVSTADGNTTLKIGKDSLLQAVETHSAIGQDSIVDFHYAAAPEPKPGDRMRLIGMDVDQQTGSTNRVQARTAWSYQTIGGVNLPQRLTITIPGAFDLPVEFVGCSVSAILAVAPPKN